MQNPYFSIIVVCLNPGEKLNKTIESVLNQTYLDYELLIKDGGSSDDSLVKLKELPAVKRLLESTGSSESSIHMPQLRIVEERDSGIYDAMNGALSHARGKYVIFLNCGDIFSDTEVLFESAALMKEAPNSKIYYGNIREQLTGQVVSSNPSLNAFGCYRNVPCHQACIYERELILKHPFELKYRVRADYEQFLWCFFKGEAAPDYLGRLICDYEGGGFSETKENRRISEKEHKVIIKKYIPFYQRVLFKAIMVVTLAPLRTAMAKNPKSAYVYNRIKSCLYKGKR